MKNKKLKRSKSHKKLYVSLAVLTLLLLGSCYYLKFVKDDSAAISQQEQKKAEQEDVDQAKQRAEEDASSDPVKDNSPNEDSTTAPEAATLGQPTFTQANGLVGSSVSISGASSGNCKFTFSTDGDKPVIRSVKLSAGACVVSIPEAEFTLIGAWNLTVDFGGKSVSRTVNIN